MKSMFPGAQLLLCVTLVALTACGGLRDRAHDYRYATPAEPLQLPEELAGARLTDRYTVPGMEIHTVLPGRFEVPRPDPLLKDADEGSVRIQSLGDERWVLVDGTPGQIWPRVRSFINQAGVSVARTDARTGIIETGWVRPAGDSEERERYRFRVEHGVQRATSEIYVLQNSARDGEQWPELSSSAEREQEMMMALAQFLADTDVGGAVSMLADRSGDMRGRVFLEERREETPHIRLQLPYDRAWASLALALEKGGFEIDDRDRSEGSYWVSYLEEEEERGWFRRLFSRSREKEPELYRVDITPSGDRPPEMRIVIDPQQDGEPLSREERLRLLRRIKSFIS